MRKILVVAAIMAIGVLGLHVAGAQPSARCDTPAGSVPVKTTMPDPSDPLGGAVCLYVAGFSGAGYFDNGVIVDGDSGNHATNPCLDGYVGVSLGDSGNGTPHLVASQGKDYKSTDTQADGGNSGHSAGSTHDDFNPATDTQDFASCY